MATVIDALLVTLGLDASGFEKGVEKANAAQKKIGTTATQAAKDMEKQEKLLSEAQVKRGKDLEGRSKSMVQGFNKIRNEALALFAVFTGGKSLVGFVASTLAAEAGLSRMASNLGISTIELAEYQLANERAGGSIEGMTAQLKDASIEVAKMKTGGSDKIYALQRWASIAGVNVNPAELKSGTDLMLARSKVLEALDKKNPAQALLAASEIGVSENTYNYQKQGVVLVEAQRAAQHDLAVELAKNGPAADELLKKWNDLSHSFELVAIKVMPKLMPYLEQLANWLIRVIPDFQAFLDKLDQTVESMGGWKTVLVALGSLKLLSMAGGLASIGVALNAIAATLGIIGGVAGTAALATLAGIGLLTASSGLNKGEDLELAKRRKMAPTIDGPANGSTPDAAKLFSALEAKQGLPAGTLDSMWLQESGRGKNMLSKAGAKGHFQFMDATAKQYGLNNPDDLRESATAAAHMMGDLLKKYGGNMTKALMAYNGGQGNLDRKGIEGMPQESKDYAPSIMNRIGANGAFKPTGNTSTSDVKVGQITINTQAADAKGIANSIGGALKQYGLISQANAGLA